MAESIGACSAVEEVDNAVLVIKEIRVFGESETSDTDAAKALALSADCAV